MDKIFQEIKNERLRQDLKWGQQNHLSFPNKNYNNDDFGLINEMDAKTNCEIAFKNGYGSWAHIFIEEVSESLSAGNDLKKLREELIQTIAVGVAWIESIDRNGK